VHIVAIAALCLAKAGRLDEARGFVASIHKALPRYRVGDFLAAFHLPADAQAVFREGARRVGID
jgi:hypothetical protein